MHSYRECGVSENVRLSSGFPVIANVFAAREAWTVEWKWSEIYVHDCVCGKKISRVYIYTSACVCVGLVVCQLTNLLDW